MDPSSVRWKDGLGRPRGYRTLGEFLSLRAYLASRSPRSAPDHAAAEGGDETPADTSFLGRLTEYLKARLGDRPLEMASFEDIEDVAQDAIVAFLRRHRELPLDCDASFLRLWMIVTHQRGRRGRAA
ncbi:MAG TPA: hypothetical protein VF796_24220 [Humisphaera sp.]